MTDIFGILFWPLVLLGSVMFALFYHRRVPKRWVRPAAYMATALVTLPPFALLFCVL